ncbi:MAG: hypothetical protein JRJ18_10950 [Deltaproteobacteria bacterium]|nr:hypothetical protein [Deltaproteobacteria bacterium]
MLDPDLFSLGPRRVKAFADRHGADISAGVDATLLQEGPVEEIVERIRHYIDAMGRDGRLMIHLNQIPAETPPEHVHAAVAAVHTFGRLPIPDDLDAVAFTPPEREIFKEFLEEEALSLYT